MMQCLSSAHGVREPQAPELQFLALEQIWTALSLVPLDPTTDPTASGVHGLSNIEGQLGRAVRSQ